MVDPISKLPKEMIVKLFSLLTTPEIARSAATSREWRSQILPDPLINQVLDFGYLRKRLSEDEILEIVPRLAQVSTHENVEIGKEIILDLTAFWKRFGECIESSGSDCNFEGLMKFTKWKYVRLITAISLATKGKLSKLVLTSMPDFSSQWCKNSGLLGSLLLHTADLWGSPRGNLPKQLVFSVPFPLTLRSRGEKVVLEVYDTSEGSSFYRSSQCTEFLQDVFQLTNSGLQTLAINLTSFTDLQSITELSMPDIHRLDQTLQKSKDTMEELTITFFSDLSPFFFNSVVNFPSLSHLTIASFQRNPQFPVHYKFPRSSPSFNLKNLQIGPLGADFGDPGWLVDWISDSLQVLGFSTHLDDPPLIISASSFTSILQAAPSLQELSLVNLSVSPSDPLPSNPMLLLSNLRILTIGALSVSGYKTLASYPMPNLQQLQIDSLDIYPQFVLVPVVQEDEERLLNKYIGSILKNCCSSLETLLMRNKLQRIGIEDQDESIATFSKLTDFHCASEDSSNTDLLRNLGFFEFPRIQKLRLAPMPHLFSLQPLIKPFGSDCKGLEELTIFAESTQAESQARLCQTDITDLSSGERLVLPKLKTLDVSAYANTFIKILFSLKAKYLEKFCLHVYSFISNSEPPEAVSSGDLLAKLESNFSNLLALEVSIAPPWLYNLFFKLKYPRLEKISIRSAIPSMFQFSSFIKHHSKSLTSLEIRNMRNVKEETSNDIESFQETIYFPELFFVSCNQDAFHWFEILLGLRQETESLSEKEKRELVEEELMRISPKLSRIEWTRW